MWVVYPHSTHIPMYTLYGIDASRLHNYTADVTTVWISYLPVIDTGVDGDGGWIC